MINPRLDTMYLTYSLSGPYETFPCVSFEGYVPGEGCILDVQLTMEEAEELYNWLLENLP